MRRLALTIATLCICFATASAEELNGTLKRIADSGEFKIGFVPDAPPHPRPRIGSSGRVLARGPSMGVI